MNIIQIPKTFDWHIKDNLAGASSRMVKWSRFIGSLLGSVSLRMIFTLESEICILWHNNQTRPKTRSKWFHQSFPCVSACLRDNGTPPFRFDQQRPGHGNDYISKFYRGGFKRGNGSKKGKGGADLKLGDSAAGSLQAFQAPHVCLWETAPPLPLDRTQWRQFYSDKESVRSQRERENMCRPWRWENPPAPFQGKSRARAAEWRRHSQAPPMLAHCSSLKCPPAPPQPLYLGNF